MADVKPTYGTFGGFVNYLGETKTGDIMVSIGQQPGYTTGKKSEGGVFVPQGVRISWCVIIPAKPWTEKSKRHHDRVLSVIQSLKTDKNGDLEKGQKLFFMDGSGFHVELKENPKGGLNFLNFLTHVAPWTKVSTEPFGKDAYKNSEPANEAPADSTDIELDDDFDI